MDDPCPQKFMISQWGQVHLKEFVSFDGGGVHYCLLGPWSKLDYFIWEDSCLSYFQNSLHSVNKYLLSFVGFLFSFLNFFSLWFQVTRSVRGRRALSAEREQSLKEGLESIPVSQETAAEYKLHFIALIANKADLILDLLTTSLWPEIIAPSSPRAHWSRTLNKVKAQRTNPPLHLPQYLRFLLNPSCSPILYNTLICSVPVYLFSLLASLS